MIAKLNGNIEKLQELIAGTRHGCHEKEGYAKEVEQLNPLQVIVDDLKGKIL